MPEELQSLLNKIQKDGVERAEAEADRIVSEAREKAEKIENDAHQKARKIVKDGEKEAEAFSENARKSVQQAARDVVLSVEEAVQKAMHSIASAEVDTALDESVLKEMLSKFVESYFSENTRTTDVEVLMSPEDKERITGYFTSRFKQQMNQGLKISGDNSVISGFRVSVKDEQVEHDFSRDAIVDALCQLLRPRIAELVRESMKNQER
jgi:V/A-type H+-transporting ATPase subunit E